MEIVEEENGNCIEQSRIVGEWASAALSQSGLSALPQVQCTKLGGSLHTFLVVAAPVALIQLAMVTLQRALLKGWRINKSVEVGSQTATSGSSEVQRAYPESVEGSLEFTPPKLKRRDII